MRTLLLHVLLNINVYLAASQAGSLDIEFGEGGIAVLNLGNRYSWAEAIAFQSDGKIVIGGDSHRDFALVRYNPDGSLDLTFGSQGIVLSDFEDSFDHLNSLAIQSDDKIVSVGEGGQGIFNFTVMRHTVNGGLDLDFGQNGKVVTRFDSISAFASDVAIQPDGKIIVVGGSQSYGLDKDDDQDFAIIRYLPNGIIDSLFGQNGVVRTDFENHSMDAAKAIALHSDGRFIVAGYSDNFNGEDDNFALIRYWPDGSIDTSFGIDGKTTTDFNSEFDLPNAIALQRDGKIVVAGYAYEPAQFAIARYHPDGVLDHTFGDEGKVMISFDSNHNTAEAVSIDSNDHILIAGVSSQEAHFDFSLARLKPDGTLDMQFGSGGKVLTDFGTQSSATAMALQSDGRIVLAGIAYNIKFDSIMLKNDTILFALARYLPETLLSNDDTSSEDYSISLYPNPVESKSQLRFSLKREEKISLALYDVNGYEIKAFFRNITHQPGIYIKEINFPKSIVPGIYYLSLSSGKIQKSIKLFIPY
jgi:uncharacterized delta-60 repeat protein